MTHCALTSTRKALNHLMGDDGDNSISTGPYSFEIYDFVLGRWMPMPCLMSEFVRENNLKGCSLWHCKRSLS